MKHLSLLLLVLALFFTGSIKELKASHIAGASITYECLGGDTYKVFLNIYRDCDGIAAPQSVVVCARSTCGDVANLNMTLQRSPFLYANDSLFPNSSNGAIEVSQLCTNSLLNSKCANRANQFPGMERYVFVGTAILSSACNTWRFSHNVVCCRNTNRNMSSTSSAVVAELNSSTRRCNDSPIFSDPKIPYFCAGQPTRYSFQAYDPDGDSLHYELVNGYSSFNCANGTGVQNVFRAPYTATSPIAGIQLNALTGELNFTPTITGNWIVVVKVSEYDAQGNLLGTIMKDMIFVVVTCGNQTPRLSLIQETNTPQPTTYLSADVIDLCFGDTLNLSFTFTDPNSGDSLMLRSNAAQLFPGSSFNYTSSGDTAIAYLRLIANQLGAGPMYFVVEANDQACPFPGIDVAIIGIRVVESVFAGPDLNICRASQQAQINVDGGSRFTWTALPGGSGISVPQNFSCDTCKSIVASPRHTTTYVVSSNLGQGCKNEDTVTVFVRQDFSLIPIQDDTLCYGDTVTLNAQTVQTGTYQYSWLQDQNILSDTTSSLTVAAPYGETSIGLRVTSDSLCTKSSNAELRVLNIFPQNNQILSANLEVCISDTVNLRAGLGNLDLRGCEYATFPGVGNDALISSTPPSFPQSNSATSYSEPSPYAGFFPSSRQQYLFRKNELLSMGLKKGEIYSIGFLVDSLQRSFANYENYRIAIACTPKNSLSRLFESGLVEVFGPKTINIAQGWTEHTLDDPYVWDGNSNLIVEVCFDNSKAIPNRSRHAAVRYEGAGFAATAFGYDFSGAGCGTVNQYALSPFTTRPLIRFGNQSGVNPAAFKYHWSAVGGAGVFTQATNMSSTQIFANASLPQTYQLVISDTLGVCTDTVQTSVNIVTKYNVKPIVMDSICYSAGQVSLTSGKPYSSLKPGLTARWTGNGITNDSLGIFDPVLAGKGSHMITHEVTGDACANKDSSIFYVVDEPNPFFSEGPFCETEAVNVLDTQAYHIRGFFVVDYGAGVVDTSNNLNAQLVANAPASVPVTYHAYNGCWADTTIPVKVDKQFDATIDQVGPFCANSGDTIQLTAADPGGIWHGPGVVGTRGRFVPNRAWIGTHRVVVDSMGYCGDSSSIQIVIPDTIKPIILDPGPYYSATQSTFISPQTVNAVPYGGRWGSEGTPPWMPFTQQALFVPSAVVNVGGFGAYDLYYTAFDTISSSPLRICEYTDTLSIVFYDGIPPGLEKTEQSELKVYPNPTSSNLYLSCNEVIKRVSVINLLGVELISQKVETKSCEVDLKDLPPGVYFIEVTGKFGTQLRKVKKL